MSDKKTPSSSPKANKAVKLDVPSTPPSTRGRKRLSNYLSTPEQPSELPLSPGMKRSSSGQVRSPENRTNTSEIVSPYSAYNLLKTPREADEDSDEKGTPRRSKLMKTPQYFSGGKRLFAEETSPSRKDLGEISSQLKTKLSSAFGSLQQRGKPEMSPARLEYETSNRDSPTRAQANTSNLNLITLEHSPNLSSSPGSSTFVRPEAQGSPLINSDFQSFTIPSPDEESSAQNALLAAFSRAKERRLSQSGERRRSSVGPHLSEGFLPSPPTRRSNPGTISKLAPLQTTPGKERSGKSEQDAIYSLMSLSAAPKNNSESPHAPVFPNSSTSSSRSSSVVVPTERLGIITREDDDATDIEEATASEGDTS